MQVDIVLLNAENSAGFYELAAEYLPGSDPRKMSERAESFPNAFLTLMYRDTVIGVCFGWARSLDAPEDGSFSLDGIAVRENFQKNGYGKRLLNAFEQAAAQYGYKAISVGSAGGYVEKFYIDLGFLPKEYKAWANGSPSSEKVFDSLDDYYSYKRKNPDGFVVLEKIIE